LLVQTLLPRTHPIFIIIDSKENLVLFGRRLLSIVRYLIIILFAGIIIEAVAEARVGRGRTMGRQSQNKPRSAQQQKAQPQTANTPPAASRPQGGSMMRGLAGGLAGGFLGSMLFSSLGHGMGAGGSMGAGGMGGGGGIGFLEIILLGGIAYLVFRWWKNRTAQNGTMTANKLAYQGAAVGNTNYELPESNQQRQSFLPPSTPFPGSPDSFSQALSCINEDQATDIFFRIQGACTRRDLSSIRDLLSSEMAVVLQQDFDDMIRRKRSSRLENISVRRVEIDQPWQENGTTLITVKFTASLLDYAVDDQSGQVVEGSDSVPVKFEENWIFSQDPNEYSWRLSGIQQL